MNESVHAATLRELGFWQMLKLPGTVAQASFKTTSGVLATYTVVTDETGQTWLAAQDMSERLENLGIVRESENAGRA